MSERRAQALLDWLRREGATLDALTICAFGDAGYGLAAARDLALGELAMRCPCRCVLTADAALADREIGDALRGCSALRGDDEHLVILLLLHSKHQGAASRFAPYVDCLPSETEAASLLPAFWDEHEQRTLLGNTPLFKQARASAEALRTFHARVIEPLLTACYPSLFPAEAFSWPKLVWAYSM